MEVGLLIKAEIRGQLQATSIPKHGKTIQICMLWAAHRGMAAKWALATEQPEVAEASKRVGFRLPSGKRCREPTHQEMTGVLVVGQ